MSNIIISPWDVQEGDKVRVSVPDETTVNRKTPLGFYGKNGVYYGSNSNVELLERKPKTPEYWPVKLGDIWKTPDGDEWMVRRWQGYSSDLVIQNVDMTSRRLYANPPTGGYGNFDDFKKLEPVLVRRRGLDL